MERVASHSNDDEVATLHNFVNTASERALSLQKVDGSMPAGQNGPYRHPETPVRNTAHWLITFAHMLRRTGEIRFFDAVSAAANYLLSEDARPYGYTHHCRTASGSDRCNGLIGPAWVLEALSEATPLLSDDRFAEAASGLFLLHPFDDETGLWTRIDIDGSNVGPDETFNHQLWFASCAARLLPVVNEVTAQTIDYRVRRFLQRVPKNLVLYDDGVIFHSLRPPSLTRSRLPRSAFAFRKELVHRVKFLPVVSKYMKRKLRSKSIGYHHFNTYAFATLREFMPRHDFWESAHIASIVDVLHREVFQAAMLHSKYGYPYNSPVFLIPYSLERLCGLSADSIVDAVESWKKGHMQYFGVAFGHNASARTPDPATFEARLYELTRFSFLSRV